MSANRDAASIKEYTALSSIIGRYVKLEDHGYYKTGKCPFHDDTRPSLSVIDETGFGGHYQCFSCGAEGDIFDFIQRHLNLTFVEAVEKLGGEPWVVTRDLPAKAVTRADNLQWVRRIWDGAIPLVSFMPAGVYLEQRGIPVDELDGLENLGLAYLEYQRDGDQHPVLLAAFRDQKDEIVAIQRTYLGETCGKLDVASPRMSLGRLGGAAIKIGNSVEELIVCEGLEDGLSLRLANPTITVWVSGGGTNLAKLPIPDECTRLVIAQDNDVAGRKYARAAEEAYRRPGREILSMKPGAGFKDFNEELLASTTI